MTNPVAATDKPGILLTGATGYVGGLLLPRLLHRCAAVRCLVRDPARFVAAPGVEVAKGDVLEPASLDAALAGIETAYYLVHLMASSRRFEDDDRQAARNFAAAASKAGVRRIIYLGGLGDESDPRLSPHLRSRHEVGRVLAETGVQVIEFRASIVIGAGSFSFELIRTLTNRLPLMIFPRWLGTPVQPIAVDDVLEYLLAAMDLPPGPSRVFEVGSPDVTSYGGLIREYARQTGKWRVLIPVPVLTPYLSSLWLSLVTPTRAEVGRILIEGLRNPMVVKDMSARQVFATRPVTVAQAVQQALAPSGKGRVGSAG